MKKILFILAILFSTQAQAVIITEPPHPGIAPRANAEGQGYSPPQAAQPRTIIKQAQPQPGYYENGRPVFANTLPLDKKCRDKSGNIIICPNPK